VNHPIDPYQDALLRGLCADGAEEVANAASRHHRSQQEGDTMSGDPPRTIADELLSQIEATHQGDPWYGGSRAAMLDSITAQQAASHPIPNAHSIWELVLHMTAWTNEVRRRLGGAEPGEPAEGDWPPVPRPNAAAWYKSLQDLEDAHTALLAAARELPAERWLEPVGRHRDAPLGTGVTIGAMLVGLAQHDAYHTGQVALLCKALE
jgi:uncharacterized damage-inducible protein DinB